MKELIRPTKVLCKRTSTIGDDYWWDDTVNPPVRNDLDNRHLVAGVWYEVVQNDNDAWTDKHTFSIINNQGNRELFYMYTEEQKNHFPSHCDLHGPRDYEKWFYTPEELDQIEKGIYDPGYRILNAINVFVGKMHWVKMYAESEWTAALCISKSKTEYSKHTWQVIGSDRIYNDEDFAAIGEEIVSRKEATINRKRDALNEKLIDAVLPLIDAINQYDPDKNYAPVEYHMRFVNRAASKYQAESWKLLDLGSIGISK